GGTTSAEKFTQRVRHRGSPTRWVGNAPHPACQFCSLDPGTPGNGCYADPLAFAQPVSHDRVHAHLRNPRILRLSRAPTLFGARNTGQRLRRTRTSPKAATHPTPRRGCRGQSERRSPSCVLSP